jgi:hypothetical protein
MDPIIFKKHSSTSFNALSQKWSNKVQASQDRLWKRHKESLDWLSNKTKHVTLNSVSGLLLLTAPTTLSLPLPYVAIASGDTAVVPADKSTLLIHNLINTLPENVEKLTPEQEQKIEDILSKHFNLTVRAELQGKRLNRNYGFIGAEQHLYRYPGDTLEQHADNAQEWKMYGSSGIAPGRGAFGYFAPSKQQFSEKDKQREKYYLAVQTFLVPDYNQHVKEYVDFFKFRKMLVVNPKTGQAVVAVIGDAGPAESTGKHLGGSPETMHYLGLSTGPRKGAVLYFFIDDPDDKIPLGPIGV